MFTATFGTQQRRGAGGGLAMPHRKRPQKRNHAKSSSLSTCSLLSTSSTTALSSCTPRGSVVADRHTRAVSNGAGPCCALHGSCRCLAGLPASSPPQNTASAMPQASTALASCPRTLLRPSGTCRTPPCSRMALLPCRRSPEGARIAINKRSSSVHSAADAL